MSTRDTPDTFEIQINEWISTNEAVHADEAASLARRFIKQESLLLIVVLCRIDIIGIADVRIILVIFRLDNIGVIRHFNV